MDGWRFGDSVFLGVGGFFLFFLFHFFVKKTLLKNLLFYCVGKTGIGRLRAEFILGGAVLVWSLHNRLGYKQNEKLSLFFLLLLLLYSGFSFRIIANGWGEELFFCFHTSILQVFSFLIYNPNSFFFC